MAANRSNISGIQRARQIANQGQTPLQQAASNAGMTVSNPPPQPATDAYLAGVALTNSDSPTHGMLPNNQGPAGAANFAIRNGGDTTPPVIFTNAIVFNPITKTSVLTARPTPNPDYLKEIPPPPPIPDPERPLPDSPVKTEVDKIIEESNEVIREVEVKQDPQRPPVLNEQDIATPPAPITPTELVLELQSNCEKNIATPTINIVNENNINIDLQSTATSSISAPVITIPEFKRGCTDPDALNYDPLALLDDGTCKFEPIEEGEPVTLTEPEPEPIDIPDTVTFVDSHGTPLFTVLKEEVTKTEQSDIDGFVLQGDGGKATYGGVALVADIKLVDDVTRPALENSDIILSLEDSDIADRKNIRDSLGELASDSKLASDQEIVIIGDREKINIPITRNAEGIIFLDELNTSKLKVSLRSRAFNFNQYKRTIDTSFSELVGKQ